jgi:GAF domain-containing protein
MVRSVARLLAVEIGQYVVADLVDRAGVLRRVHIEHADPRETPRLAALRDLTVLEPRGRTPRLLSKGGSELVANVSDAVRKKALSDLVVDRKPVRSYMATTIVVDGSPLGVLSLVTTRRKRRYTEEDADLLAAVADFVGLGLENALRREAQPRVSAVPDVPAARNAQRRRA